MNETPLFFSNRGSKLFGVLHDPEENDRHKAFVFCHPFAEEKLWSHRVFVSFARKLARRGYTVFRFDYRGYGDSEGDFADMTMQHQLDDIESAVSFLQSQTSDTQEIGLLGYRLGATLALRSILQNENTAPLILWDPILNGERYAQEFLRSHLTTQLAVYGEIRETRDQLLLRMRAGERVNVEGYDVTQEVYDSLTEIKVPCDEDRKRQGPTLLVQVGKTAKPIKQFSDLAAALGASLACTVEEPFWREIKPFYYRANNIFDATIKWMQSCS